MLYKKEYIENNKKLKEENKRLNDIINKVIEYIKENDLENNSNYMDDGIGCLFTNIIYFLQGSDKD